MKKNLLMASLAVCSTLLAGAAFAQDGSFKDVPNDHWAYAAIEKLTSLNPKVFIGDPDGMFRGKRNLTRYEMAVIIARLLENIDATYAKKTDLAGLSGRDNTPPPDLSPYAKKSDLAGLASKSDVDTLRRLTGEFQTELNTLGVDVDNIKKRLDGLDKRVGNLEEIVKKLPKISGDFSVYARGNGRTSGANGGPTNTLLDRDGFGVSGSNKTLLNDTRGLHDFNLDLGITPDENTSLNVRINHGNYLSYVYGGSRGAGASLAQMTTIWSAVLGTKANLPLFGETKLSVGRVPTQFTPYTFKLVDPDTYLENSNTDSGNIPVDGIVAEANLGKIGIKAVAAKVDPIAFGSAIPGKQYTVGATGVGSFIGPVGMPFNGTRPGGAPIEQVAGAHLTLPIGKFNLNATGLAFGTQGLGTQGYVYGGGLDTSLFGFGVSGSYNRSESDVPGSRNNNEATDAMISRTFGSVSVTGGYRDIQANFNAPGAWERLGTYQNPTDIKGGYGKVSVPVGKIGLSGEYHNYDWGTTEIENVRGGVSLGVGSGSLMVGAEQNKVKAGNVKQNFFNVGYSTMLSTSTTFKLGYQLIDYKNFQSSGANKGNVVTGTFNVKF
ncbi:MAG: S-layer homology domain-containing protein [Armatimonas sp.]